MNLANLHICTCLTDPSLYHTVISSKIKYATRSYHELFCILYTFNVASENHIVQNNFSMGGGGVPLADYLDVLHMLLFTLWFQD